jgi:hypothetical protein
MLADGRQIEGSASVFFVEKPVEQGQEIQPGVRLEIATKLQHRHVDRRRPRPDTEGLDQVEARGAGLRMAGEGSPHRLLTRCRPPLSEDVEQGPGRRPIGAPGQLDEVLAQQDLGFGLIPLGQQADRVSQATIVRLPVDELERRHGPLVLAKGNALVPLRPGHLTDRLVKPRDDPRIVAGDQHLAER